MFKDLPPREIRRPLLSGSAQDAASLHQLALARVPAVRGTLLARSTPSAQVLLAAPKLCNWACENIWRPHVELLLGAH